ncbi:hypothetical protein O9993_23335 [Vibrio lentus]|nr:hypothetical protein [Vibrio lentus]
MLSVIKYYGAGAGGYGYDLTVSGKARHLNPDQGEDNFPGNWCFNLVYRRSWWSTNCGATGSWTYNV